MRHTPSWGFLGQKFYISGNFKKRRVEVTKIRGNTGLTWFHLYKKNCQEPGPWQQVPDHN